MARSYRRLARRLTAFAVIVCILAVLTLFVVHSGPVRRYATNRITAILAQRQIEFETDELGYNLLNASLDLRNVRVRSARLPDAPVFATIGRARVDLSLPDLIRGRYVVESGTASGVTVHYFVDEQGRDNLPRPPRDPNEPEGTIDYLIASLSVSNATVRYENRAQNVDARLPVSAIDVDGNRLTDRHHVRLDAGGGEVRVRDRSAAIDRVAGDVEFGDEDATVERLTVQSEGSSAELVDVTYGFDRRQANASSVSVRGDWGAVTGNGRVSLDASGQSNVNAKLSGVDVGQLMRMFDLPYNVATRIDGNLRAEWPGLEALEASGQAEATLTPTTSRPARSSMPVAGRLIVRGSGGRIDAHLMQVSAAGAQIAGRVGVDQDRRLSGAVSGRAPEVANVLSSLETFLGRPRGSLTPTPIRGAVTLDARLAGTVDEPAVTSAVNAPALNVGAADGVGVSADLAYVPAALTVRRADLMWEDARLHVDGRVGLAGDRRLDVNVTADAIEVPLLLKAANQANVPASGTLSARGMIAGTTTSPLASLMIEGNHLAAYEETIGSLNAEVNLRGREAELSRLVIDKPQPDQAGRISATGTYHLDNKTYTFDLQSEGVRLLGLLLPNGQRIRTGVELEAKGSGSVSAPAGELNASLDNLEIERPAGDSTQTTAIGPVVIKAVAENEQGTITAKADQFKLDAEAIVALARPWPTTATVRVNDLDLVEAGHQVRGETPTGETGGETRPRMEGRLSATVKAEGDLAEPARGTAMATIETLEGSVNGRPFAVKGPTEITYADERLSIEQLEVEASGSVLTVKGELPLTERGSEGELAVDLRGNLTTLTQYLPPDVNIAGDGSLELTGTIKGTLKAIDPDLVLTVEDGLILSPLLEPGFSDINLRATISDGEANIEKLAANWGSATLEGSGRIPLEAVPPLPVEIPRMGGPATFKARVNGLDPSAIPGASAALGGRISIEADVSASRADLAALQGQLTFPQLELTFNTLDIAQKQPSTITFANGTATVQQLDLSGSAGTVAARGSVGLVGERAIDVNVDGMLNAGAVSVLTDQVRAEGDTNLMVHAGGTIAAPEVDGTITLKNASVVSEEPNVAAENLNAEVTLNGKQISLTSLTADVNGGTLKASGDVTLGEGGIADVDLRLQTRDFAYDAPLDLRSLSDADIRVHRQDENFVVSGKITISEAGLTGDINFDEGLLAAMTARRRLDLTEERNMLLERVRFEVDVETTTPILVDNNLARAEVRTDVRVVGTPYETGLTGQLTVLEGGEIRLNERRYEVERGTFTFLDERRIFPTIDLRMNTSAGNYDITIAVTGTPGDTETTLTSEPTLPEPDIMAMLVTGRTLDDMRGEEYEVAREQALSYLAGRVGSSLGRGLQQATGLSEVRIEPTLIASEADPGARLTLAQEVTDELKLVYSTNLTDSNDQIWVAEYDVTRRFQTRGVRQSDATYRVDFRHDVRFGGEPAPRRTQRVRPKVADVAFTAEDGQLPPDVRNEFDIEPGDEYDFFAIRNAINNVESRLMEQGYLQSRIRLERSVDQDAARLTVNVRRGPMVEMVFAGANPPKDVQDEVRTHWQRGVFDKQRADDGMDALREWLMIDGYLQPKLEYRFEDVSADRRRITFQIEPGQKYDQVILAFEGASQVNPDALDRVVEQQNLERQLFTDPLVVTELLERYYREEGFLSAEIDEPRIEFVGSLARVSLDVREGPRFGVRRVSISGNNVWSTDALLQQLPVSAGGQYLPSAAENALEKIRTLYWPLGFNDIRSDYSLVVDRALGQVDIHFEIDEGSQSVVDEIMVRGTRRISEQLVRRQLEVSPGQPLDLSALARSRRNLYETGSFSVVEIDRVEPGDDADAPVGTNGSSPETAVETGSNGSPQQAPEGDTTQVRTSDGDKPVSLNVFVREVQPVQLRYGGSYDTEHGVGVIFDISQHNWLGGSRVIGLQSRYDRQLTDGRIYVNQPAVRFLPFETTGSVYYREDRNPPTEITRAFTAMRKGVSIQQEMKLRDAYVWSWGYRYEHARTLEPGPNGIIGETQAVSPLNSTITRETRDEALDATRGSFLSQAMSFSPGWLGSDVPYLKYLGQYFHYFPLQSPRRKPLTNEILRPRLVFATGIRVGLAKGIGGIVPMTERFFAGGSVTLRGFAQNAVGPIGPDLIPTGGNALFILNNELRAPLYKIFDGVVFMDIGNVFPRIKDLSFTEMRESAGVGLRVRTPWVLIRGDYGFVLDPRPGERRSRFYVSIGQAF